MASRRLRASNLSNHDEVGAGYNRWIYYYLAYFVYTLLAGVIYYSFIIGTSKIIGTLDFKAFPAIIACLNFKVGKILAIPSPK